jgi:hypothetical protein
MAASPALIHGLNQFPYFPLCLFHFYDSNFRKSSQLFTVSQIMERAAKNEVFTSFAVTFWPLNSKALAAVASWIRVQWNPRSLAARAVHHTGNDQFFNFLFLEFLVKAGLNKTVGGIFLHEWIHAEYGKQEDFSSENASGFPMLS